MSRKITHVETKKCERVIPAPTVKKNEPLPNGRNSPDSNIKRDGKKHFDF
jgi:hypothetical protein